MTFNGITWTQSDTSLPGTTGIDGNKFASIIVNTTSASNTTPIPKMDFCLRTAGSGGYMKEAMSLRVAGITSAAPISAAINGDLFIAGNTTLQATSASSLYVSGDIQVDGNTTLGNASSDTLISFFFPFISVGVIFSLISG